MDSTDPRRGNQARHGGPAYPVGHAVLADPNNTIVPIAADRDWTSHEVTAQVPGDADFVMFGIFLAGSGRIELRDPTLTRA